jgi:hypothetical protein
MSFTYRFIFDPLKGDFNLTKIPISPIGSGGTTVTSGVLYMPSGTTVECDVQLIVSGIGGVLIEEGSTLLVQ